MKCVNFTKNCQIEESKFYPKSHPIKKGLLNDSFLKLVHFVVVTRLTFMHKAAQEKMKNVKIRREKESTTAMNANIKKSPNPI